MVDLDWVPRVVASATPYTLAVNVPYALAFFLVGSEVAWLARRPGPSRTAILRSAATAGVMAAGAFAVGVLYTNALRFLWEAVGTLRWDGAAAFWRQQPAVGALATFVAWDFCGWVYHLIGHTTQFGWAAHQPHHSGEGYDATLALRQSWTPFHTLLIHPVLALAGFDLRAAFVCAAISNCWQVFQHTGLPVRFPPWIEATVMTPVTHRHHHARGATVANLGPFLTCWDRIAGTWVAPTVPPPAAYGPQVPAPSNPVKIELAGWLDLVGGYRSRRAHKKSATWAATAIGKKSTVTESSVWIRAATDHMQKRPSMTSTTTQPVKAPVEPLAAFGARTKPSTTTAIRASSASKAMMSRTASSPPSNDTVSASICPPS